MVLNYRIGMLVLMFLGAVGCERGAVENQEKDPEIVLRLKPSDLFAGDSKRIVPHVRLAAFTNVKFETTKPVKRLYLKYKTEQWAHGKVLPGYGDGDWSGATVGHLGEISISLKSEADADVKMVFDKVVAITSDSSGITGRGTITISWKKPADASMSFRQKTISQTIECPKDETTTVWGYYGHTLDTANKMMHRTDNNSFEELARDAEWAVSLQLKWKEWSPDE